MTEVTICYFDGCPHWQQVNERLRSLRAVALEMVFGAVVGPSGLGWIHESEVMTYLAELGFLLRHELVATVEDAEAASFRGSPTILIDGRDPFARGDEPVGLSCRIYQTPNGPAGSPTDAQLREVLS